MARLHFATSIARPPTARQTFLLSSHDAQDRLALQLLGGEFRDGEMIVVDAEKGKLVFSRDGSEMRRVA